MGPVSIRRIPFDDESSASAAARVLRSNGIRIEALNREAAGFAILIRADDSDLADNLLNDDASDPP